jgi:antitoxin MazE
MGAATKTELARWGHSLAVRIPKPVVESARLREGDPLTLSVGRDGTIAIKPARRKYTIEDLVGKITSRNRHGEADWGKPLGKELW